MFGTHEKWVREHKGLIHDSPLSMQIPPAKNMNADPAGSCAWTCINPSTPFATSLGTSLGVEALCENAELIERFREPPGRRRWRALAMPPRIHDSESYASFPGRAVTTVTPTLRSSRIRAIELSVCRLMSPSGFSDKRRSGCHIQHK